MPSPRKALQEPGVHFQDTCHSLRFTSDAVMNIAICRLMGLALGPQLPPLDVKSAMIIITLCFVAPLVGTGRCLMCTSPLGSWALGGLTGPLGCPKCISSKKLTPKACARNLFSV